MCTFYPQVLMEVCQNTTSLMFRTKFDSTVSFLLQRFDSKYFGENSLSLWLKLVKGICHRRVIRVSSVCIYAFVHGNKNEPRIVLVQKMKIYIIYIANNMQFEIK